MTREEVVQAALTVERWCKEHYNDDGACDCPFAGERFRELGFPWHYCSLDVPQDYNIEEFLRTRGLKHDD